MMRQTLPCHPQMKSSESTQASNGGGPQNSASYESLKRVQSSLYSLSFNSKDIEEADSKADHANFVKFLSIFHNQYKLSPH